MPIAIHDEVVGSIGIRGDSEEVEKYGMLVKMVAEIMLKDRIEAESAHIRHSNLQMLATMIITYNGDETAKSAIINQGILLGFNLTKPRIPIIVSKSKSAKEGDATRDMYSTKVYRAIKRQFHDRQDIIVVIDAAYEKYLIFAAVEREIGKLTDEVLTAKCKGMQNEILESEKELIHIALSKASSSVSELKASYERAEMLLATTLSGSTDKSIVRIIDVPLERMLIEAAEYYKGKRLERRIKGILNDKNAELFEELIITWCESMFNFAETARRLGIHKNTLTYRFEKIKENCGVKIYNLGTGKGSSVLDVVHAYEKACGKKIPYEIKPRRAGDLDELYSKCDKAEKELHWTAKYDLEDMCADSWKWQSMNPNGYND